MSTQVRRVPTTSESKKPAAKVNANADRTDRYRFSINKTKSGLTRIAINEYRGELRLDMRHYYFDADKGDYLPTPKGTSIPLSEANAFVTKLGKMLKAAGADFDELAGE